MGERDGGVGGEAAGFADGLVGDGGGVGGEALGEGVGGGGGGGGAEVVEDGDDGEALDGGVGGAGAVEEDGEGIHRRLSYSAAGDDRDLSESSSSRLIFKLI